MDVSESLELLMNTNPPYLSPAPKAAQVCPILRPPSSLSAFYDQHIDSDLALQKIKIVPLATFVALGFDRVMQSIQANKKALPLHTDEDEFQLPMYADEITMSPIVDARTLAELYQSTTAHIASVVASTMLLHLDAPGWFCSMAWIQVGDQSGQGFYSYTGDFALRVLNRNFLLEELSESIDQATQATLDKLNRAGGLAYWEIFAISPEAENVLKKMDSIGSPFVSDICQTKGYVPEPLELPSRKTLDAKETGWGDLVSSFANDRRPVTRASTKARTNLNPTTLASQAKDIVGLEGAPPSKTRKLSRHKAPKSLPQWHDINVSGRQERVPSELDLSRLFLQRAWARSTEHDTTYTIFNCGNFERIGFRHRASQTLFLSDLINIPECRDPHYVKIQSGLYLSVLQDVLDRFKQLEEITQVNAPRGKKRGRKETLLQNKRPRTRAQVLNDALDVENDRLNREVVAKEVRKRPLALFIFRYGIYNSPAPASFLRMHHIQKDTYTSDEYLKVVITSKIAAGATGIAHGADVEMLVGGTVRRVKAVVKLAFGPKESERMRHEFTIYEHLATHGVVEGIPTVYGLFEDLESSVLALVMSHVGSALVDRYPGFVEESKIRLPEQIRSAFMETLRSIHAADVRHNDIRAENLAISDDNRVAIIDFDRAQLRPSRGAKRREMRHLEYALNGEYPSWYDIPSPLSTPGGSGTPESSSEGGTEG